MAQNYTEKKNGTTLRHSFHLTTLKNLLLSIQAPNPYSMPFPVRSHEVIPLSQGLKNLKR